MEARRKQTLHMGEACMTQLFEWWWNLKGHARDSLKRWRIPQSAVSSSASGASVRLRRMTGRTTNSRSNSQSLTCSRQASFPDRERHQINSWLCPVNLQISQWEMSKLKTNVKKTTSSKFWWDLSAKDAIECFAKAASRSVPARANPNTASSVLSKSYPFF